LTVRSLAETHGPYRVSALSADPRQQTLQQTTSPGLFGRPAEISGERPVKALAQAITLSNDEDGFAAAIGRYILDG
jgi:hypothetical protein